MPRRSTARPATANPGAVTGQLLLLLVLLLLRAGPVQSAGTGEAGGGGPGKRGCRGSAMARPALGLLPLLLLLLSFSASGKDKSGPDDLTFVSEYFSQSAQKLSFYTWYRNAKLFRFHVPEDTVLLRWLLQASRGGGPECSNTQVIIHFRYGAPPVINPLGTEFPANTSVQPSYTRTLTLTAALQNSTFVNLTSPAAGDWFIAAHLPEADGKIEVKGFSMPCAYIFQPDMFVLRIVDMAVLEPNVPLQQTITRPARPVHAKIYVPEYSATLHLELQSCTVNVSTACAVLLTLGSSTLPQSFQQVLNCTGREPCSLLLSSPPWEKWLRLTVESLSGPGASVSFEMVASFAACKPGGAGSFLSFYRTLNRSQESLLRADRPNSTLLAAEEAHRASEQKRSCLHVQPVIREDLDVMSVQFRVLGDTSVSAQAESPTVLLLNLNSGLDNGGTLVLNLMLNKTSLSHGNATVLVCLNAASPVLSLNATRGCRTAFSQGSPLNVTASSAEAALILPFPQSDNWFLSLQLLCPEGECEGAQAQVAVLAYLSPCFDDCGTYGHCSLLQRHSYLYAGCSCKAGWSGWSCTDGTKAQSVATQTLATLLLTLSNLLFLPAICIALSRFYLVEASVYAFTMFFSTFYHACDQPGVAVLCIMEYDTLQFCDFLGSVVSIWVTILCMARVKKILKYVLCVSGTLVIAMSLQLDRRGVWNMMGPCLFALVVMTAAWVYHGVKRHHCYPPSWKRWAFFLVPGLILALVAIAVYAFMETTENYYYTHSIWHMLVASSVAFFLPPGDKHKDPWAWSRKLLCRYQICKNDREELYAVT
ncbi:post-GPI attachment to proteins factor 6 [Hemicordylus capensis]|uniref:post-GPI attachment to proteins factor 6 n=1 Tax=Hemicordylus capensis TaxID=884348 RepID=UPI002303931E|nr:post-GPI attachment to proteins factor 6 [Hemicordylus capensis]